MTFLKRNTGFFKDLDPTCKITKRISGLGHLGAKKRRECRITRKSRIVTI